MCAHVSVTVYMYVCVCVRASVNLVMRAYLYVCLNEQHDAPHP